MNDSKNPRPGDIRAAAQSALQAAQDAASGALRMPIASAQVIEQLPGLIENLATATERLNKTLDRFERYMALADPTLQTIDRLLPQLEAMVARGDEAFQTLRDIPGVGAFGRLTGFSARPEPEPKPGTKSTRKPPKRK